LNTPLKVSVIIPAFNCGRFLSETLESVFAQSFRDYEIVVVNDGSTDETEEVIRPYQSRLIYIVQPNKGLPAALNAGLKLAKGELIAILDADDIWHPDKLKEQVQLLDKHPQVGLCFTNYTTFGGSEPTTSWFADHDALVWKYPHRRVSDHNYLLTGPSVLLDLLTVQALPKPSSLMFRRKCIDRVGYFDESLTFIQDTQICLRIGKHFPFAFTDLCLLHRRIRENSLASIQSDRKYVLEHIHMLEKLGNWIDLTRAEKKAAEKLLAAYSFAAGYLDFTEYLLNSSRRHFWKSLKSAFGLKAFLYLGLTLFPKRILIALRLFKGRLAPARPPSLTTESQR
jgi:glycosyltransferase involved in cell wall biosynthesis